MLAAVICSCVISVLPSYSVLILIDGQYLQNVVFSFELGSNGQNQSLSDPHLWIKKSSPHWDGGGNPHYPLVLFGKASLWKHRWPQKFAPRCQIDLLTLLYYPVHWSSFPRQRGLDSATCLDGLTAFLHLLPSSAKEVDNRSLSSSLLMLSNRFFLGWPRG